MSDAYVRVTVNVTYLAPSGKAFKVEIDGEEGWIPCSLIHAADERSIGLGERTIRLRNWKAKELGLG